MNDFNEYNVHRRWGMTVTDIKKEGYVGFFDIPNLYWVSRSFRVQKMLLSSVMTTIYQYLNPLGLAAMGNSCPIFTLIVLLVNLRSFGIGSCPS